MKEKVVLAYSGGLDTTALIPWLKETFDYDVVCCCVNCGQGNELDGLEELLQLLKDHKDKKADNSRKIWTVLTFLIWYDRFFATCSKGELVTRLQ